MVASESLIYVRWLQSALNFSLFRFLFSLDVRSTFDRRARCWRKTIERHVTAIFAEDTVASTLKALFTTNVCLCCSFPAYFRLYNDCSCSSLSRALAS